jgi:Ca2+-binding RTX toxin-like protein
MRRSIWIAVLLGGLSAAIVLTGPASAVSSSAGKASASCHGHAATIVGTRGNDTGKKTLRGTRHADVIVARAGKDEVHARQGNDVVCGGAGGDLVDGGAGRDRVYGQGGSDLVLGRAGRDKLLGGTGDDELGGGPGRRDLCAGGPGKDLAQKRTCERIRGAKAV